MEGGAGAALMSTDSPCDHKNVTPLGCDIKNPYEASQLKINHFLAPLTYIQAFIYNMCLPRDSQSGQADSTQRICSHAVHL